MIETLVFYMFSALMLGSSAMVVSARNPVHAVLYLILAFFNAAGLFLMLGAEFVAFTLVIVYVGAVAVLFLFVVMMLDINRRDLKREFSRYIPLGGAVALILLTQLVLLASAWTIDPKILRTAAAPQDAIENTRALGRILYTDYFYPFQASGFILLVAMLGAIVLTLRSRGDVRRQNAAAQLYRPASEIIEVKKVVSGQGADV